MPLRQSEGVRSLYTHTPTLVQLPRLCPVCLHMVGKGSISTQSQIPTSPVTLKLCFPHVRMHTIVNTCEQFQQRPVTMVRTQQPSQHTGDRQGLRTMAPQKLGLTALPHSMLNTTSRHGVLFNPAVVSTSNPSHSATVSNQQSQQHILYRTGFLSSPSKSPCFHSGVLI